MSPLSYPSRVYLLSDTFGGQREWNPYTSPDIDAHITTDIRSRVQGVRREFDIFGAEGITDHVLRTIATLHEENHPHGSTGVFINSAPRTDIGTNGESFYVAEVGDAVRVVATPLAVLAAIREKITRLWHLPNEDNGLYGPEEQFRSSYTPQLLAPNHGLSLDEDDPKIIPEYPEGCRVSYVDRFGNLVLFENNPHAGVESLRDHIASRLGEIIGLKIGQMCQNVVVGTSLKDAPNGTPVLYKNDGHFEVIAKWQQGQSAEDKLKKSAYEIFGRPEIGTEVSISAL